MNSLYSQNSPVTPSGVQREVWGVQPPPPKFRSFDKVESDSKLRGKCLVFFFQHPNKFKNLLNLGNQHPKMFGKKALKV